jgi:hypothetical protein
MVELSAVDQVVDWIEVEARPETHSAVSEPESAGIVKIVNLRSYGGGVTARFRFGNQARDQRWINPGVIVEDQHVIAAKLSRAREAPVAGLGNSQVCGLPKNLQAREGRGDSVGRIVRRSVVHYDDLNIWVVRAL